MDIIKAKRRIEISSTLKKTKESIEKGGCGSVFKIASDDDNCKNRVSRFTLQFVCALEDKPINIDGEHDFIRNCVVAFINQNNDKFIDFVQGEFLYSVKKEQEALQSELIKNLSLINGV